MKVKISKDIPEDALSESIERYQRETNTKMELTETDFEKFLEWVKKSDPELLKKYGIIKA